MTLPQQEDPTQRRPDPPCWHNKIGGDGICLDCGSRAAISLTNVGYPAHCPETEWAAGCAWAIRRLCDRCRIDGAPVARINDLDEGYYFVHEYEGGGAADCKAEDALIYLTPENLKLVLADLNAGDEAESSPRSPNDRG